MFSVIFDMDGTLLDTQRICIPAWDYAGELQGIENVGSCIAAVCGMNEIGWTKYLEDRYQTLDMVRFKKDMREYIIKNGKVTFKKGAAELLNFLKTNNIKLAIASGSSVKTVTHHLAEVNAVEYFDVMVGGSDVEHGKPAPDIFLLAAEKLGVSPVDCFVFEDSANGIKAGFAAGMKCIGVPDVADFDNDTKNLMFAELSCLSDAIEIFEKYM